MLSTIFPKAKYKPPTVAARKNAAALAAIVGGVVVDAGSRCMMYTYSSKKLSKIDGAVECRGPVVTVVFEDISVRDAGAMLAVLAFMYGKKRGGKR